MQAKVEFTNFRKTYRSAKPRLALTVMPRLYFHQRSNGKLAEDRRGRQFGSVDEACTYTIHRTPAILGKTLRSATNTYLSTVVFDGKRSICVVRATVIIERR
jgi:hypothetical protein